jgi:type I restriction enzyme S subunit
MRRVMIEQWTVMPKYELYKDSWVEWLGEIPAHWKQLPMCAVSSIKSITNVQDLELLSVYLELGVIRFSDADSKRTNPTSEDLSKYQLVSPGDFVLNNQQAWRGSVGVSQYSGIVSPAYLVLKLASFIDPNFANYLFRDGAMVSQYLVCSKGVGTIQRNLYWPQLRRSLVCFPPIPEQTAIASFLDCKTAQLDQAVAIKEKQIALLKERKQILIQNSVIRGLNPDVPMRNSGVQGIGEIPAHWGVKSIRYAFTFLNNRRLPLSAVERESRQGTYPYYGASGVIDYVDQYLFDEPLILIAEDGANLLSKSTPLAFVAEGKYWVNNHAHIIKPKYHGFRYWAELLSSLDYTVYISGAAQPKLTRDRLASVKIPVPPKNEIIEIIELIETESAKIEQAISIQQQQIDKLKEYKTTLINSAVTGKIRVSELVEGSVPELADSLVA